MDGPQHDEVLQMRGSGEEVPESTFEGKIFWDLDLLPQRPPKRPVEPPPEASPLAKEPVRVLKGGILPAAENWGRLEAMRGFGGWTDPRDQVTCDPGRRWSEARLISFAPFK